MRKTTPEEVVNLVRKHGIDGVWTAPRMEGLAALIDEVRGVDAGPVAYQFRVHFADHQDPGWSRWQECNREEFLRLSHKENNEVRALYTHPAPSQPAAPVELPVVANKLPQPLIDFEMWLNEPPSREESREVRDYRFDVYRRWETAIQAAIEQVKLPIVGDVKPVATVDGNEMMRQIIWSDNVAAFDFPVGTKLYAYQTPAG